MATEAPVQSVVCAMSLAHYWRVPHGLVLALVPATCVEHMCIMMPRIAPSLWLCKVPAIVTFGCTGEVCGPRAASPSLRPTGVHLS